jgi:hypothetical protein
LGLLPHCPRRFPRSLHPVMILSHNLHPKASVERARGGVSLGHRQGQPRCTRFSRPVGRCMQQRRPDSPPAMRPDGPPAHAASPRPVAGDKGHPGRAVAIAGQDRSLRAGHPAHHRKARQGRCHRLPRCCGQSPGAANAERRQAAAGRRSRSDTGPHRPPPDRRPASPDGQARHQGRHRPGGSAPGVLPSFPGPPDRPAPNPLATGRRHPLSPTCTVAQGERARAPRPAGRPGRVHHRGQGFRRHPNRLVRRTMAASTRAGSVPRITRFVPCAPFWMKG